MQELGLTHVDGSILYRDLTKMKFVVFVLCVIPLVTCLHVTPEPPTLECGFVYCSSDEFCDIIIGCSACAIICQPDISNTECQKQCPGKDNILIYYLFIIRLISRHNIGYAKLREKCSAYQIMFAELFSKP